MSFLVCLSLCHSFFLSIILFFSTLSFSTLTLPPPLFLHHHSLFLSTLSITHSFSPSFSFSLDHPINLSLPHLLITYSFLLSFSFALNTLSLSLPHPLFLSFSHSFSPSSILSLPYPLFLSLIHSFSPTLTLTVTGV